MRLGTIFITDRRGLRLARHAVGSFALAHGGASDVRLYCDGFELAQDDPLTRLCASCGARFSTRPLSSASFAGLTTSAHISATSYAKFAALADAAKDFGRVLYADTDILFFAPLPLATVDLAEFPLAATHDVAETGGIVDPEFRRNCARNGLSDDYFNSGLMLFDVARLDLPRLEDRYHALIAAHEKECPYKERCVTGDQCVWNQLFEQRWLRLPFGWNAQSSMRFTPLWAQAQARHYTGPVKFLPARPWRSDLREARLIATVSERLGFTSGALLGAAPFDLLYRLNAQRWRESTQEIEAAARRIGRRIRDQQASLGRPPRFAQTPSAPSLSIKATTSSTPTPWRIEAIT